MTKVCPHLPGAPKAIPGHPCAPCPRPLCPTFLPHVLHSNHPVHHISATVSPDTPSPYPHHHLTPTPVSSTPCPQCPLPHFPAPQPHVPLPPHPCHRAPDHPTSPGTPVSPLSLSPFPQPSSPDPAVPIPVPPAPPRRPPVPGTRSGRLLSMPQTLPSPSSSPSSSRVSRSAVATASLSDASRFPPGKLRGAETSEEPEGGDRRKPGGYRNHRHPFQTHLTSPLCGPDRLRQRRV